MKLFTKLIFIISLFLPISSYAGIPLVLTDVSAGLFRFQMSLAEQGNPEAQYKVGEMYELGKGAPKDQEKALQWFEKAAAQGHAKSSYKILYLEIKTKGLNDSNKTQLGVLRQESASGNADAQYFLGKMYATGVGVPKSLDNALTWLNKATFNGIPEAEHEAIAIEEELARTRAKETQKRAKALEAAKQKKAEEQQLKAQKQAEDKRKADEAKLLRQKELELKRAAEERRKLEAERAALAREKARLQQQRAQQASQVEEAPAESNKDKKDTFESDPCKGPQARFLSTCR